MEDKNLLMAEVTQPYTCPSRWVIEQDKIKDLYAKKYYGINNSWVTAGYAKQFRKEQDAIDKCRELNCALFERGDVVGRSYSSNINFTSIGIVTHNDGCKVKIYVEGRVYVDNKPTIKNQYYEFYPEDLRFIQEEKESEMETIVGKCVDVDNPEISEAIQKLALKNDIKWHKNSSGKDVLDLFIRDDDVKTIRFHETGMWCFRGHFENVRNSQSYEKISLDEAIRLIQLPKEEEKIMIGAYEVKFPFQCNSVEVGCQRVSFDIVKQIAKRVEQIEGDKQ